MKIFTYANCRDYLTPQCEYLSCIVETSLGEIVIFFKSNVNFCYIECREMLWETRFHANIYCIDNIYYIVGKNGIGTHFFKINNSALEGDALKNHLDIHKTQAKIVEFRDFKKIMCMLDLVK